MRRDHFITFALAVGALCSAVALMAAPLLATDPARYTLWLACFLVGAALMVVSFAGALVAALGDKTERIALEKRGRMIPLIGMVVCGVGLLSFAGWYFWPSGTQTPKQNSLPIVTDQLVLPGPHARVTITNLVPYVAGTGPVMLDMKVTNTGDAASTPATIFTRVISSKTILDNLQLNPIVDSDIEKVTKLFLTERKEIVSIQPGESGSLGTIAVDRKDWRSMLARKTTLYVVIVAAYSDANLRPNAAWVHVFGAAFVGVQDGFEIFDSRTIVRSPAKPGNATTEGSGRLSITKTEIRKNDDGSADLRIYIQNKGSVPSSVPTFVIGGAATTEKWSDEKIQRKLGEMEATVVSRWPKEHKDIDIDPGDEGNLGWGPHIAPAIWQVLTDGKHMFYSFGVLAYRDANLPPNVIHVLNYCARQSASMIDYEICANSTHDVALGAPHPKPG